MNTDITHRNWAPILDFCYICCSYLVPINDRDSAGTCNRNIRIIFHNGCCIFIDANADQAGMRRNQVEQSAKPVSLTKVLVKNDFVR